MIPAGSIITSTNITLPNSAIIPISIPLKLNVFVDNGQCTNSKDFKINIVDVVTNNLVTSCGSYLLPAITIGGYFTQPAGAGVSVNPTIPITTNRIVYYYAPITNGTNCTTNSSITITINPNPVVDVVGDVVSCGPYFLPNLTNGEYRTLNNGLGTVIPFNTQITTTQTIYIYKNNGTCAVSNPLLITIKTPVPIDNLNDVIICATTYTLPILTFSKYYTATNGTGTEVNAGTVVSTTTVFYVYNNNLPNATYCPSQSIFNVAINNITLPTFSNIAACETYTLPALTVGSYFYASGGVNPVTNFVITNTTTPTTIYVYAQNGTRTICSDEKSFTVTISTTPVLDTSLAIERCGKYTLPALLPNNYYFSGTNGTGTQFFAGDNVTKSITMFIYAYSPTNANCKREGSFVITINPLLVLNVTDGIICVDFVTGITESNYFINTGLNPTQFTANYYFNGNLVGTGPSFTATAEGVYTIKTMKLSPEVGLNCNYADKTVTITKSSRALAEVVLSEYFVDDTVVTITNLQGYGNYVYQLDDSPFQIEPVFYGPNTGSHIITIKDTKNDCGVTKISFNLINYPKFFTPNGDGFNETWNVFDLQFKPDSYIEVFDRFGKLIKQFSVTSLGWDGTYNGKPLPATDYWFLLHYKIDNETKEFRSHFALKR